MLKTKANPKKFLQTSWGEGGTPKIHKKLPREDELHNILDDCSLSRFFGTAKLKIILGDFQLSKTIRSKMSFAEMELLTS